LVAIIKNPMMQPQGVQVEDKTFQANSLDNKLKALLNQSKYGQFTKIIEIQNKPTMFFLKEKKDFVTLPYEDVKQSIYRVLSKQKEEKVIKDYFEKVKSSATINVVRSPS